jgi:hypothetical protein
MGDYTLKTHMFSISMGGCDIVLGVEWLHFGTDYHGLSGVIYALYSRGSHLYPLWLACWVPINYHLSQNGETPEERSSWGDFPI